jgi:hypothetical protein
VPVCTCQCKSVCTRRIAPESTTPNTVDRLDRAISWAHVLVYRRCKPPRWHEDACEGYADETKRLRGEFGNSSHVAIPLAPHLETKNP